MSVTIERYVIKHISGSKLNQIEEFDFSNKELSIGRAAGSDIQFDPEQETIVSREHGRIVKETEDPLSFTIYDNNSRNGIFVNKERVKGKAALHPGDTVQLGSTGPVFSFDVFPRPQDLMAATRLMEIPTSIKATQITEAPAAEVNAAAAQPQKTGLGKQTVERMLVTERKKSYSTMGLAFIAVLVILGVMGFAFRDKLFKKEVVNIHTAVVDSTRLGKMSPDQIARENEDKVVQIEFGWQLFDANTSDELWHEYAVLKGEAGEPVYRAMYIEDANGNIQPYLSDKRNVTVGAPIGVAAAYGSGFVVSEDGFILTNRHVATMWNSSYEFPQSAFPGVLIRYEGGKPVIVPGVSVNRENLSNWVPSEASMMDGAMVGSGTIKGRNTYMNVVFSGTSLRRPVVSATPSDDHDVAMIKVELPESLPKVEMREDDGTIQPGQSVTVMGYPSIAPQQFVVRASKDMMKQTSQVNSIPTSTVTPGNIGRLVPASSLSKLTFSGGEVYQLTINATGSGNSGGPMFDDEGKVIGIFYASSWSQDGTRITFAVPIKYGLELMGRKKVN